MKDLKDHLICYKSNLVGKWLERNSSYEEDICRILHMDSKSSRYYDATWNAYFIEFKKGKSIWLDLVRYSEVVLKSDKDASKETITLFFIPADNKAKIESIICVETEKIIAKLSLDEEIAGVILNLNKRLPRSLNAQASLTIKDVKER